MVGAHQLDFSEWKRLKNEYIDKQRNRYDGKTIDAAAHLLLEVGDPVAMLRVAVDYLGRELTPCRIDAGLGTPRQATLSPDVGWFDPASDAPSTVGLPMPNYDPVVQRVWRSPAPIAYHDCSHPRVATMSSAFARIRTQSMMAQRIEHNGEPLGMLCIDQTTHARHWKPGEQETLNRFCREFLAPLLAISSRSGAPTTKRPSAAEMEAIRLAAEGLSYKEIAKELGKSVRTIEHQLRSARQKVQASNQADLVRKCLAWL